MINFNSIDLSQYIDVTEITGRGPLTQNVNTISIPGMPGVYVSDVEIPPRNIGVSFEVVGITLADIRSKVDQLNNLLKTEKVVPIIFSDEPTRTYYGLLNGEPDWNEILSIGAGTINFLCPDPYKYGPERTAEFTNISVESVAGNVDTEPVISVKLKQNATFVAVSNGDKINLVGNPTRVEQTATDPETSILVHGANTLTGWTTSSATSVEDSDLTGTLKTNGEYFYTDTYGTSTRWHGPAMKTSLSQAVQDFRFDIGIFMKENAPNQAGGIEVSLLDANNLVVAKMALTKHFGGMSLLYAKIRAGKSTNGYDVLSENQAQFINTFGGILRVTRKGTKWTAKIYQNLNGEYKEVRGNSWIDTQLIASSPVTQVQVKLTQRASFPVVQQYVTDINIYKLNDLTASQIPIIAKAGEIVEFDHTTDIIRKNGIDFTKEKAFIGEYFLLSPGPNTIAVEPAEAVEKVTLRWRDRWQ